MHYVRLLRPPKHSGAGSRLQIELVFTITSDLGDSFLFPEEEVELLVRAERLASKDGQDRDAPYRLSRRGELLWTPGMRVMKRTFDAPRPVQQILNSGQGLGLSISALETRSGNSVEKIMESSQQEAAQGDSGAGLIMPASIELTKTEDTQDFSIRCIQLGDNADQTLELEEEIGESIARHVWDAGVMALCTIVGSFTLPELSSSQESTMKHIHKILQSSTPLNILELGCGVGILGLGMAMLLRGTAYNGSISSTILMTDLQEAEERANSNIERFNARQPSSDEGSVEVLYENLDWEDGRLGKFGPLMGLRSWDLIMLSDCTYNVDMLPALVETLSAIHASNTRKLSSQPQASTKVFLATKPRHDSEKALFSLLYGHGWMTVEQQTIPLPVLGSESESVEMYIFEKT